MKKKLTIRAIEKGEKYCIFNPLEDVPLVEYKWIKFKVPNSLYELMSSGDRVEIRVVSVKKQKRKNINKYNNKINGGREDGT